MASAVSSRVLTLATAGAVVALDRWTKWLVETRFNLYDTLTVIPGFFNIVRSENPGVAFGMLSEGSTPARTAMLVITSLAAIAILGVMLWKIVREDRMTTIAIALIFGGAVGNVYDRITAGKVTDFLDFYAGNWHWYTFNLADSAICIGAGVLAVRSFLVKPRREANA